MSNPVFKFALRRDLIDQKMFLPTKGEPNATGYDVKAAQLDRKPIELSYGQFFKIPLGFRAMPQDGWWYQLHPRSSSFLKKSMPCLIGIIDQDFPLELVLAGQFLPENKTDTLTINFGDAIGQIIPVKRESFDLQEVSNEEYDALVEDKKSIRTGGFGSTGK